MSKFDKKIKEAAMAEHREVPQSVKKVIDDTLDSLPESSGKVHRLNYVSRIAGIAACFVLVLFVVIPNVSPAYAEALEGVPVIGKLIKLVTVRNYYYSDGNHEMNIKVPEIQDENEAGEFINKDVNAITEALVNEFYKTLGVSRNEGYGAIYLDYDAVTETPLWFTLKLSVTETAADSHSYFKFYNIDRVKGEIVDLGELFASEDSLGIVSEEIERQMKSKMAGNPELVFWTEGTEFKTNSQLLKSGHNYYWNKEGNLVIPFDKYEVGPGYMGAPEFEIEKNVIKNILKPEYREIIG